MGRLDLLPKEIRREPVALALWICVWIMFLLGFVSFWRVLLFVAQRLVEGGARVIGLAAGGLDGLMRTYPILGNLPLAFGGGILGGAHGCHRHRSVGERKGALRSP